MTPNILLDTNAVWMPKETREHLTRACQAGKIRVSHSWQEWLARQSDSYIRDRLSAEAAAQAWRERCKDKRLALADLDWLIHKADWAIAAVAQHTGWPIVTNDADPPFRQAGVMTLTVAEFTARYLSAA